MRSRRPAASSSGPLRKRPRNPCTSVACEYVQLIRSIGCITFINLSQGCYGRPSGTLIGAWHTTGSSSHRRLRFFGRKYRKRCVLIQTQRWNSEMVANTCQWRVWLLRSSLSAVAEALLKQSSCRSFLSSGTACVLGFAWPSSAIDDFGVAITQGSGIENRSVGATGSWKNGRGGLSRDVRRGAPVLHLTACASSLFP